MWEAGLDQLWPGDRGPRRRQLLPQGPSRAAASRPASVRQRWLAWLLAMAALTGALLGVGCNASWLADNRTARGVALPAAMDSTRLLYNAHYYQLMGRPEIALKELQQAHEVDPANLKVVDALAQMYQEQGQFQRAQELYQETLKRYGENRALHNNWCFSYYLQGDLGRAESCLQEALARDPGNMAARNNLGLLWCRQGKLAEAKRLWEEAEVPALAQTRMNQALAFLGMSAPAYYAKLAEPGPGAPLADSSAKSPAAAVPPTVKGAPAARPLAAAPKAEVNGAAKATEPGLALPQQPAASRQPKSAAPAIIASQDGSLLVAEGQTSARATPAAGFTEAAKVAPHPAPPVAASSGKSVAAQGKTLVAAPAPQKPAAPVLVTTQAGSLAAEPPITGKAATPAAPAATRPTAGLTEAAKVAPPPAPPVATSSGKSVAAQGKTLVAAPAPQKPTAPVLVTTQAGSLAAEPPITGKAATPAAPAATRPTAGLTEAAKVAPHPAPPVAASSGKSVAAQGKTLVAAPARQKPAAPVIVTTQAGSLPAEPPITGKAASPAAPAATRPTAGLTEAAKVAPPPAPPVATSSGKSVAAQGKTLVAAPARQKPAAPVLVTTQAGSLAAEPPITGKAATPAAPAATRPTAGLTEAAKVAPPPAPPVATSSGKSVAAQGKTLVAAPARPLAAAAKAKVKNAAKAAAPRTILTAAERLKTGIEILNGNGTQDLARLTRTMLFQEVFNVARIGNYIDFGAESTVIYYRPGMERVAGVLHSEIFPEAQLMESSKLRKGVAIKILPRPRSPGAAPDHGPLKGGRGGRLPAEATTPADRFPKAGHLADPGGRGRLRDRPLTPSGAAAHPGENPGPTRGSPGDADRRRADSQRH